MNRVSTGVERGSDNLVRRQVAVFGSRRSDVHLLIGEPDVQPILNGFRTHGDRGKPERPTTAQDAASDFPAVCHQDFAHHRNPHPHARYLATASLTACATST